MPGVRRACDKVKKQEAPNKKQNATNPAFMYPGERLFVFLFSQHAIFNFFFSTAAENPLCSTFPFFFLINMDMVVGFIDFIRGSIIFLMCS